MPELSKSEIVDILKDESLNERIFSLADKVRKKYVGDEVHLSANVVMPNVTSARYRAKYEIYPDKNSLSSKQDAERLVKSIGRTVSTGYGFRRS